MAAFRVLLLVILLVLAGYTAEVISNHGWGLLAVFFGDIGRMEWPGQFNLDFLFMLTLSATWVAWRHGFSPVGLVLAALAFFGGAMFLAVYLLIVSWQAGGDVRRLLLGDSRSGASVDGLR